MSIDSIISLMIFLLSVGILVIYTWTGKRQTRFRLRQLQAMNQMRRALGASVEQGKRVHISLGSVNLLDPVSASTVASLTSSEHMILHTIAGDLPPIVTSGDGSVAILSQDVLSKIKVQSPSADTNPSTSGSLTGLTPWSYAAGAMTPIKDKHSSTNIFLGHFGPEAALMLDAAEQSGSLQVAGSDNLAGQAVMYAAAQESLLGEEVFAVTGYLQPKGTARAGLKVQDLLRWLFIGVLILAAIFRFILSLIGAIQ